MPQIDIEGGVPATALSGGITAGATSISVTDGTGYPTGAGGNFYIVIDRGLSSEEVIECSARSGNTLTAATRGADGTSATAHDSAAVVEHCVPASALQETNTHANQTTGTPHGSAYVVPSGNVATATALETARTIGGVSFDGTGNINLPGVNQAGNQDTTGNAATATALETARSIGGASFDGTADVSPPALTPIGSLLPYAGTASPDTNYWLLCDGDAISRSTYSDLFAVIGTSFGVGDGSTTFNLPDLRGRVPMGLDNLGGVSANRVTSTQADALGGTVGSEDHALTEAEMPSHTHTGPSHTHSDGSLAAASSGAHTHSVSGTAASSGSHTHGPGGSHDVFIGGNSAANLERDPTSLNGVSGVWGSTATTASGGAHTHSVSGTAASGGAHSHDVTGSTGAAGTGATGSTGADSAHNIMQPSVALGYLIRAA